MSMFSLRAQGPHGIVRALTLARNHLLVQVRATAAEPDERFAAAFARLVAQIEAAFRQEEILMESAGAPGLHAQRQDNALLLSALHHALPQVEAGNLAVGREVVAALRDLLALHRFSGLRILAAAQRTVLALRQGNAARPRGRTGLHGPVRRQYRG